MKKFFTYLRNTMALLFFSTGIANSQCPGGQVEVFLDIATDQWGYEVYWSLTAQGDTCGGTTEVANGGNTFVGCYGGGARVATGADPGAYGNNITVTEGPFCLDIGQAYTLHMIDDWGDGLCSFSSSSQGFSVSPTTAVDSVTFVAQLRKNFNISAGNKYVDAQGWELDWARPVNHVFYPTNQLTNAETQMGVTISNFGLQPATGVYAELNIDRQTGPGVFTNVFNDTMQFANILPDSVDFNVKPITDTSWYATGLYRYQYIIHMDSTDESPESDTLTDFFNLTDGYWSRVELSTTGFPFGTDLYLPGAASGPISGYEWGSMYYVKSGAGMEIDTFNATLYSLTNSQAAAQFVTVRLYEVILQGATLDMNTDIQLVGIAFDTIAHITTGGGLVENSFTNFVSAVNGQPFEFSDNKLYYISIHQEEQQTPFLNDGTTQNGFAVVGRTINHDFSVYSNTPSYPFFNHVRIEQSGSSTWYTGWVGGPEPAIGFTMKSNVISNNAIVSKPLTDVVVSPNPTSDIVNVNVSLENINDIQYVLTDASGRLIQVEKSFDVMSEVKSFDLSKYPSGIYMLHINSEEGNTTKRIIKK